MTIARTASICAGALGLLAIASAAAQDSERGRMLHDNHCRMCHDSIAYKRGDKIAKDAAQVRAQVVRWQTNTGLRWTPEDIDSVTAYLVVTYYQYPLPGADKRN